jgi:hypothetical protein
MATHHEYKVDDPESYSTGTLNIGQKQEGSYGTWWFLLYRGTILPQASSSADLVSRKLIHTEYYTDVVVCASFNAATAEEGGYMMRMRSMYIHQGYPKLETDWPALKELLA